MRKDFTEKSVLSEDLKGGEEPGFPWGKTTHSGDSSYNVPEAGFDFTRIKKIAGWPVLPLRNEGGQNTRDEF